MFSKIKLLRQELTTLRNSLPADSCARKNLLSDISAFDIPQPFKPLPNVESLRVRTNKFDPLFARFGLEKKLSPELQFVNLSRRTKAANRYLNIMYLRLSKLLKAQDHLGF